ncbi:MAG: tol-pal system protein YbgF [Rhodoferax sp.]|nr:tol-pal system protein YbgF [Rhodoferax sp.]
MKSSRIPKFSAAILAVATALTFWSGSAFAGLFDDEEARKAILDLRQRLEASRTEADQKLAEEVRKLSEESVQLRRGLADLLNQLELTKADLAKLRGQDEQVTRDLAELQRRHKDSSQAFDERLRKFEPARVTHDGKEFTVEAAERRDYEAAMAIFRKGEFANVQVIFVDFLNRYVTSGYRPSALFWLGNAQYATKDYKEALANFRALIVLAPDHLRVPEAMLAIANCLLELKDNKGARKTLEDLLVSFPTSEAAAAAKDRLARFK